MPSRKLPAFMFYPGDWVQDTRVLSLEAKGAWIDMLCAMWRAPERGKLQMNMERFARLLGTSIDQTERVFDELKKTGICDIVMFGNSDVMVVNRRMYREEKERIANRLRVRRYRAKRSCNAEVTTRSSFSFSFSPSKINKIASLSPRSDEKKHRSKAIPQVPPEEVFLTIPLVHKNEDGEPLEYPDSREQVKERKELIPGVDIEQVLRNIRAWNLASPQRRKTAAGILKHITSWIAREQDKGNQPKAKSIEEIAIERGLI